MKLLIETERATLHYLPNTNAILLTWLKVADADTYKHLFTQGLTHIRVNNANSWISDIRNEGVIGTDLSVWLKTEIIPKAIELGLKRIAIVMDPDVFKKFYVNNIKKDVTDGGIKFMEHFDSLEKAQKWIMEKDKALA
ncbi:hypothetical protein R9C00_11555 [Flammeovirgaceae bacterium SG7u.111]|nr:hypothetical protein [Flammeovirgaceae bacterium SG7u.132]WPO38088.1 hypothetical protein R9C00_11555 [Flammeovirgaceae bacterium SG7u.111]